jgi:hypothetical protein
MHPIEQWWLIPLFGIQPSGPNPLELLSIATAMKRLREIDSFEAKIGASLKGSTGRRAFLSPIDQKEHLVRNIDSDALQQDLDSST